MPGKIALGAMVIILLLVNWSIARKESHLSNGHIAYLDLAPVDPRSLMQGDYMALRFRLANDVNNALAKTKNDDRVMPEPSDGYLIATLDKRHVASFKALYQNQALSQDEILLRYRIRNGVVKFATNAFFFQEGHAKIYEAARYGQFRVDDHGDLLLAAMYDKDLNKLMPEVIKEQEP